MSSRRGAQRPPQPEVYLEDHYEVLGLSPSATQSEIRQAYRREAMNWHPDKNTSEAATETFKRVGAAFEVLSDPVKRAAYHSEIRREAARAAARDAEDADAPRPEPPRPQPPRPDAPRAYPSYPPPPYVDPFDVFSRFFGGADPFFAHPFGGGGGFPHHHAPPPPPHFFGGMPSPFFGGGGLFGPPPPSFFGPGEPEDFFGLSRGGAPQHGTSQPRIPPGGFISTSSFTSISNGVRTTKTTRTIRHPDGRTETNTEESSERIGGMGAQQQQLPSSQQQQPQRVGNSGLLGSSRGFF